MAVQQAETEKVDQGTEEEENGEDDDEDSDPSASGGT